MAIRAPSPSRFIKLPGPARTPPRTPADEYKMFDEFVRAPYVMYKPPGTPASRFELAHQPLDSPWGSALEEAGSVDSIESQGSWVGTAFKRCTTDRPATRERLSALSRGDTPYDPPLFDSQDQKDRLTQQAKFDRGRALEMAYTQKLAFAGRESRGLGFDTKGSAKAAARASRRRSRRSREVDSLEMRLLSGAPAPAPAPAPAAARIYR